MWILLEGVCPLSIQLTLKCDKEIEDKKVGGVAESLLAPSSANRYLDIFKGSLVTHSLHYAAIPL